MVSPQAEGTTREASSPPQCTSKPTRIYNETSSCIDHYFIKNIDFHKIIFFIIKNSITNHFSCLVDINMDNNKFLSINYTVK